MELFKVLNKYRSPFSLHKSALFKEVDKHKQSILKEGFAYNDKKLETLFILEIVYKGIQNKQKLETTYYTFLRQNEDVVNYMTYNEKQHLLNLDMQNVLETMPSFTDDAVTIFVPYLDHVINDQYVKDYQLVTLKQYSDYICSYPRKLENIIHLYKMRPFLSDFSSLSFLGQDDIHYYFYYSENKTVYIFHDNKIQEQFCIVDQYHDYEPLLEDVKRIVQKIRNIDNNQQIIDLMHKEGFLSNKAHKKMSKKLG